MKSARKVAWEGLEAIVSQGQYANLWMRENLEGLTQQEKGWVTQVIYGTLRNLQLVRYQWSDLVKQLPSSKIALLLDMSVYQLFWLHSSVDYAVVNEAVELCYPGQKGLVNALLRKVVARGQRELPQVDSLALLSLTTNHPQWLLQLWSAHYGPSVMEKLAKADLEEATVHARINPLKISRSELCEIPGVKLEENGWSVKADFPLAQSDLFKEGKVVIQDRSSQEVALLLNPKPLDLVLDACSAPGTKTTQLAAMMENQGTILACDLHEHRLRLVDQLAEKLDVHIITTQVMDATHADEMISEQFDKILLDVPCSGLGVLKRKPDILCRLKPENIDEIILIQKEILNHCAPLLKVGGTLVYSTCTLNKKENEKQVERFLKAHENYKLCTEKTIFSYESGNDGFYMAKIVRCA